MEEAKWKEEETMKKEEEAQCKEDEAKKKDLEARRQKAREVPKKELEAKRNGSEAGRKGSEVKCLEEEARTSTPGLPYPSSFEYDGMKPQERLRVAKLSSGIAVLGNQNQQFIRS
ncbi:hypothetical protein JOM56_002992 [Amanita muscaria]